VTKKDRILQLLSTGLTPVEVAEDVGCRSEYVRVVRQRERCGGSRPCDTNWDRSEKHKKSMRDRNRQRYAIDPEHAAKRREYSRSYRKLQAKKRIK
jgi:hypothetical protein